MRLKLISASAKFSDWLFGFNRYVASAPLVQHRRWVIGAIALFASLGVWLVALPASAHHAMDNATPRTWLDGLISGLAHPIIGLDHLAFVLAIGLLAARKRQGLIIPAAFLLASVAGTGLHLRGLEVLAPELLIAVSVLLMGGLLAWPSQPPILVMVGLGAIAGIFHGYAYGEAIAGAEMAPLAAYLAGLTLVQMAIAALTYGLGHLVLQSQTATSLYIRFAGFTLCGVGVTFLSTQLLK